MTPLLYAASVISIMVSLTSCYLLVRDDWVFHRRRELIDWHYSMPPVLDDFNVLFGSHGQWLFRFWCWNPAKLAGLERWPV